jgi:[NiFe] hydrogenase assembly HybE family chaperone
MYRQYQLGVAGLEAAFRRIAATRMAGLPINHPQLAVEGVGFRIWQRKWLGVLVTPWAVNLVLLPGGDPEFEVLTTDKRQTWRFPSGEYDFMGGDEEECGAYQFCSLVSPVPEEGVADQAAARALAAEVLVRLFSDPADEVAMRPATSPEQSRLSGPLSRRGFITGLLPARN